MTLNDFRNLLKICSKRCSQSYWKNKTQDSGEFLFNLLEILQVDIYEYTEIRRIFSNNLDMADDVAEERKNPGEYIPNIPTINTSNKIVRKLINRGMLQNIESDTNLSRLVDYSEIQEVNYLHIQDGWEDVMEHGHKLLVHQETGEKITVELALESNIATFYKYLHQNTKITSAGLLIFQVERKGFRRILNENKLIPEPSINLGNNTVHLFAIVCYVDVHYMCLFKRDGVWYMYDDTKFDKGLINRIGSYENMLVYSYDERIRNVASKRGTLYYYG